MHEDHRTPAYITAALVCALVGTVAMPTVRGETLTIAAHSTTSIQIANELRSSVETMLDTSATFRDQFDRLQKTPGLVLAAKLNALIRTDSIRARSSIRRYSSGLVVVVVEIGPGVQTVEMIAHEFEHVLEQLEGLDLQKRAERRQGAWFSSGSMVETTRAMQAGRTVLSEVNAHHGDKSVQAGQ